MIFAVTRNNQEEVHTCISKRNCIFLQFCTFFQQKKVILKISVKAIYLLQKKILIVS